MRRTIIGTLVLATGVVVLGARGVGAQQGSDLEDVRAVNRAFYEAASARDLARMEGLWAHEPYVRAIHPGRPMEEGWETVRAGWRDLFEYFTDISVTMPEPHVRVGGDMAWVTGQEEFRARNASGEEVSETLLGTSVYEKAGDEWRMVHHHVSGLPLPPQQ